MNCALTTGFVLDCKDAMAGVKSVSFATLANYTALAAVVSSGTIQSWGSASNVFYKYEQLKETSSFTDGIMANPQTGGLYYEPSVVVVLPKLTATKRNEIRLLAKNVLVAIVELMDGTLVLCGQANGLDLTEGNGGTGTAAGDLNGYTLTFTGKEPLPHLYLSTALAAAVTSATTTSVAT